MLSFFPRGVLDEILNLIESVSEGFSSYSLMKFLQFLMTKSLITVGRQIRLQKLLVNIQNSLARKRRVRGRPIMRTRMTATLIAHTFASRWANIRPRNFGRGGGVAIISLSPKLWLQLHRFITLIRKMFRLDEFLTVFLRQPLQEGVILTTA